MSSQEQFLNGKVTLLPGDCLERLREIEPDSVDACVTDPPYGLGFMGKHWDHGVPGVPYWKLVLRVLKPGAHLLAMGGTRTFHRMVCAIEDAGFEVRDMCLYLYGSGFPKSLDVSKAIDKARDDYADACRVALWLRPHVERVGFARVTAHFGFKDETMARARWTSRSQPNVPRWEQWIELKSLCGFSDEMDAEVWRLNGRKGTPGEAWERREIVGSSRGTSKVGGDEDATPWSVGAQQAGIDLDITAPATDAARQWSGFGTALKPAVEPIILARKPLSESTVAANVLRWGTGALNIDGARVATDAKLSRVNGERDNDQTYNAGVWQAGQFGTGDGKGRWPANLIHDGSEEVVGAFPDADGAVSNGRKGQPQATCYGDRAACNSSCQAMPTPVPPPASSTPRKPTPMIGSVPATRPSSPST